MGESREVKQFDALLGGAESLPHEVHILKFAAARSKEVAAMTECILNPCSSKLVFQTLPVHMRRRIMSHNSKRLPRKLRQAHEAQLHKSGLPSKQKRPSRKYRRRPTNLLSEYIRRQRKHVWLETHIWHAKRFHMTEKWGYKLPRAPCDKAFRACYRAGSKHCLLQDISYYPSVQLFGKHDELISGFQRITNPKCGLGLTSKAFMNGGREGSSYIFNIDKYPFECAGKIDFFWKSTSESLHCIWIFAHPLFYKDVINILIKCFDLTEEILNSSNNDICIKSTKRRKLNNTDTESGNVSQSKMKLMKSFKNLKSIKMIELKDTINRFRLTGPLSHAILNKVLVPVSITSNKQDWFCNYCEDNYVKNIHNIQSNFWSKFKNLNTPAELPCHLIVGLNVKDPRINIPSKRSKAMPEAGPSLRAEDYIMMPDNLSFSPLWCADIRETVSNGIISNCELNKLRETTTLVPGCNNSVIECISGVPVILIQRPGSQNNQHKRIGYNSGWDIIMPGNYGMAFWMSFILRGARTGGLRETDKLAFESGSQSLQPDTAGCQIEDLTHASELREKYFKLPPNKRANFMKLNNPSPFMCPWKTILNDWKTNINESDHFYVIRDKVILKNLQQFLKIGKIISDIDWKANALVPVKLLSAGKGKISNFASICLPNKGDNFTNKSSELVEPIKTDKNEKKRHVLRSLHQKLLKRLRRKCVRRKRKLQVDPEKFLNFPKQDNSEIIAKYFSEMSEFWLPTSVSSMRWLTTRQVMGYVTQGDFSFTEAKSVGIGYITLQSLQHFVQSGTNNNSLVLTRNTTSRQYRFSKLEVLCDF